MSQSVFPVFASRATIEALFARRRSESTGGRSETRNGCGRRPYGAAHVKSWSMCAESPFGRALRGSRKSLSGLRLHHGLRDGCAAPETEAVAVATRLFRCLLWHLRRLGCALHPKPPRRVATGPAVLCRKAGGRARRGQPDSRQAGRPPRTGGLRGRGVKPGRGRCVGADADRGVGAKTAVGGRSQPPRGRTLAWRAARAVWATAAAGGGFRSIRLVPKRRSDGLPARDCWCGSYYLVMSIAIP